MGREIFHPRQVTFLAVLGRNAELARRVYLTGGTALAAFYLNHRESEDLDFFSETEIEPLAVETFLKGRKAELGFETFEFQKSFNRSFYFLHFSDGEILKTEFAYYPFPRVAKGLSEGNLAVDSMRDIAVNKVFTVSQQTRARDFVDLYFILRKVPWQLPDLVKVARIKFDARVDPIQLGAQLLKVRELKDLPRMRVPFDAEDMAGFFLQQAASLRGAVLG